MKYNIMKKFFLSVFLILCFGIFTACSGTRSVDNIPLFSIYDEAEVALPIKVKAYHPGEYYCGKAGYSTDDSEEKIVEKVTACGAEFTTIEGYRFFTLPERAGVFSLRISESSYKRYAHFVLIDDMSCEFAPEPYSQDSSIRFPFPYFLCYEEGEAQYDLLTYGKAYQTDETLLKTVLNTFDIWERHETQNGYQLSFKGKSISCILENDTVIFQSAD